MTSDSRSDAAGSLKRFLSGARAFVEVGFSQGKRPSVVPASLPFLDAPGEGDETRGEDRTRELGNVRRDFSNGSLEVRLDRFSLAFDELREARERLELGLLAFG